MDIDLEIYQGRHRDYWGKVDFNQALRDAALLKYGEQASVGHIEMHFEAPVDVPPWPGPPQVRSRSTRFGHCHVRLLHDGEAVRDDRMSVNEFFGPVLADLLHKMAPQEEYWEFDMRPRRSGNVVLLITDKIVDRLVGERPAPVAKHAIEVDPGVRRHRPFTLTPIAAAEADEVQPELLGLDPARLSRINILMSAAVHDELTRTMPLSNRMEEGGFLLGRVSKAGEDAHLVEITHITPAHESGAGVVHFTFTGDSFLAAARLIADRGEDEQLVGWFHTHLFGADDKMGLSSIDVDLHLATFQRPWQVAALLNLDRHGRLLRFYGRDDKKLREYDQWIADDSGKYRPADRPVGGR